MPWGSSVCLDDRNFRKGEMNMATSWMTPVRTPEYHDKKRASLKHVNELRGSLNAKTTLLKQNGK